MLKVRHASEEEDAIGDSSSSVKVWSSKEFSPLPITGLYDRHVLIDEDTLSRKIFRSIDTAVTFTPGDVSSLLKQEGAARSVKRGWRRSPLFRTDGTSLKELWFLPKESGDATEDPVVSRQGKGNVPKPYSHPGAQCHQEDNKEEGWQQAAEGRIQCLGTPPELGRLETTLATSTNITFVRLSSALPSSAYCGALAATPCSNP